MISPPAAPVAFSVARHLIYTSRPAGTQGRNRNVLAKAKFVGYTSGRPIGMSSRRLNWRRRGAAPLRQAHDTLSPAGGGVSETPPDRSPNSCSDCARQEVLMQIRIRRHNKSWHGTQVTEAKGIIAALAHGSTACYKAAEPRGSASKGEAS
jgi:hypothetical protein